MGAERTRRAEWGVFALLLLCYGWFFQGGGWNQNGRFDQVRAVVEQGTFAIDDYLAYRLALGEDGAPRYRRVAVADPATEVTRLPRVNTLDLSLYQGRYYPNKPPGATLLGVPVYWVLHRAEGALGLDPDSWRVSSANLWLVTCATVGLLGAIGGAAFLRLSGRLHPETGRAPRILATLAFGLGTLVLPCATLLMDHVPDATLSLLAFALLFSLRERPAAPARRLFASGTLCGLLVLLNYVEGLTVVGLGLYALWLVRGPRRVLPFALGGLVPALLLGAYHAACFDGPFALAHDHQLGVFADSGILFGMFGLPRPEIVAELLVLPYRGLFVTSPVLVLAVAGLVAMARRPERRPEAALFAGLAVVYLLLISSMNGWHSGSFVGPRYLMPALPFLALALPPLLARLPRLGAAATAVSIALMTLVTAVDPQVDVRIRNPLRDFYLPVALGRTVRTGDYRMRGPVSSHPIGVAGGELEVLYPDTRYARWNSWNLGELLFPGSWASLAPLAALGGALAFAAFRDGRPRRGEG
jgi:hypothetical protein